MDQAFGVPRDIFPLLSVWPPLPIPSPVAPITTPVSPVATPVFSCNRVVCALILLNVNALVAGLPIGGFFPLVALY